jgi:transcription elongation GreA/GreB family factor
MSVAFRRESDEEHLEPKFEQPIAPGPNLVTARGAALIAKRAAELDAAVAAASDDVRDALKRDLRYWRTRQATAVVTAAPDDGSAGFGSRVRMRMDGSERVVTIVGGDEADPAAGLIGFQAPLARALTGACAGDIVPFGEREIEVLEVDNGEG